MSDPPATRYDLQSVKLPYLAGRSLRLFVRALEGPLGGLLIPSLLKQAHVTWLREQTFDEPPTPQPSHLTGRPLQRVESRTISYRG
jgi:hypothetical protein